MTHLGKDAQADISYAPNLVSIVTCRYCCGTGTIHDDCSLDDALIADCPACAGKGRLIEEKRYFLLNNETVKELQG